jgi:pyruvate dehydrogenase E1 component alpha subunit/2-oxoisovalerate dehydrogenase E1 component alpha subunit
MIVADLLRLVGHGEHDDFNYVNHALKNSPIGRDCIQVAQEQMLAHGWSTEEELKAMRERARAEVEEACATANREARPDPNEEEWCALSTRYLAEGSAS